MTYSQDSITDPSLKECLELSVQTRDYCNKILSQIEANEVVDDSPSSKAERSKDLKRLLAVMAQLKTVHRMNVMNARDSKQDSVSARQEVDRLHLQLQNLYYEQRHLRGEIAACRDFPHKYTELPLISEEDFLEENPELRDADPHTLMIARLRHEKTAREQLEVERKQLLQKKQALVTEIKKRKDDLSRTGKAIEKISADFRALSVTLGSSLGSV
ncbi:hypothetical protein BJ508DRAFT_375149 [Ascobolus immersus RN42]|uniref:Fms interacting protein n=1 Tax=Ascobolus immersus RN42 TaxID=1160509 RepID=A0A3N4IBB7_ASCIM|nr:hypothetical protein BJ508DRAFT_375149 [Ascobolus immersus RN42]